MHRYHLSLRTFVVGACVAVLGFSGIAAADPPSRVARLGYLSGPVSFSPAGEDDWVRASINRPLTTGDRLWADAGSRVEIQVGGAMIRMNAGTGVSVLNLDDRIAQLQLTQGELNVRVWRLEPNQVFEVDTPNLAFTLRQPGEFRIAVDPDGNATTIIVRKGQGEVYGDGAAYVVDSRQPYRFTGSGLREYEYVDAPRLDEFDRWAADRDRRYDSSPSARYVSQDVIGYQDLDANGSWRVDATYGNVWIPSRVDAGWAPYRDGHWAWVDPWGWTWVDDAPWGFAVSHYGRWTNLRGTWGWVPGPVRTRAYYAPALVAFVGGSNFQLSISSGIVGGIAWFPLGPREVYRPSYPVSRGYFENVNRSNTVINTTVINNYYNNTNVTNVVYANRQVPGAIVAVPTTAFVQSQPVSRVAVRAPREMTTTTPVVFVPAVAPTERSVRGAAAEGGKPPSRTFERPVVARSAPPAAQVGFAAQQQQLAAKPGQPLDDATRRQLKPSAAVPAPAVKVVTDVKAVPPTMRPPPAADGAKPADARGKSDQRGRAETPVQAPAPVPAPQPAAPQPRVAPPKAAPPAPTAQPAEQRGKSDQRGRAEPPAQAPAPVPVPPQAAPQPRATPPKAAPPAPTAQPAEQRGKSDQRGRAEPPVQAPAPVPVPPQAAPQPRASPPQAAPQPRATPPQAAPPAPTAQPAEQRGKSDQRGRAEPPVQAPAPVPAPPQAAPQPRATPPQAAPQPRAAPPQAAPQPAAAPPQAAPQTRVAPPVAAPKAVPPGQEAKPAGGKPTDKDKPTDKGKDADEQKADDDRKGKG